MLGYIYSAITLFAGTAKGYCGKRISEFTTKISDAIHISALRMAVSAIFGFLFLLLQGKFSYMGLSVSSALCVLWSAIANSAFVVLWLCCVHSDAYMLVEVALTLGVPIAVCGSVCIPALNETLRMNSVIGMLALVIAAVLMQGYNRQMHRERLSVKKTVAANSAPDKQRISRFISEILYCFSRIGGRGGILILYISAFSTDSRHLLLAAKAEMQNPEWSNEKNSALHSCYGNLPFCKYVF